MLECPACAAPITLGETGCTACGRPLTGALAALAEGVRSFSEFHYDAALKQFGRARQISPADPLIQLAHAHGLYHAGHADASLAEYRKILKSEPSNVEVRYNLGQQLINEGRMDQARDIFDQLVGESVEVVAERFYLGLFFGDADQFRADCLYNLAIVCWNRAETDAAEHHLLRARELNPRHAAAARHLGHLYMQARDFDKAIEHYTRFLEQAGEQSDGAEDRVEILCNLGIAHFELARTDEALEFFKRVLQDRPDHPASIYHMNLIFQREGLYTPKQIDKTALVDRSDHASTTFGLADAEKASSADLPRADSRPIIGKSIAMHKVLRYARLAAASTSTVLLTGENGTGKELIARAIHVNSPRRDRAFIPINCAAIPESLIESELFGHEKGAFTGADETRIGRFQAADKGTIFLDEIGELDLNMQVKLLRFLQEREIDRVGGSETITLDVRIIAATNSDLESLLERNLFRQDLFFRLNVLPIHIPPLRDRPEDVRLLVDHFTRTYRKGSNRREAIISEEDMGALIEYDWPGNIRELENVIERAMVMGTQVSTILQGIAQMRRQREKAASRPPRAEVVRVEKLIEDEAAALAPSDRRGSSSPHWEPVSIRELERRHILQTLGYTSGNRAKAAQLLGINPATLWRKIKSYEVSDIS